MQQKYHYIPETEYYLFTYQEEPGLYTGSFVLGIDNGNTHPCLRTDRHDDSGNIQTEYRQLLDHEFLEYISVLYPGYLRSSALRYSERATLFVLENKPWVMHDMVVVDCRSGQPYRNIAWVWGAHCPGGGDILIPLSYDEVRKLVPETAGFENINADNWKSYVKEK